MRIFKNDGKVKDIDIDITSGHRITGLTYPISIEDRFGNTRQYNIGHHMLQIMSDIQTAPNTDINILKGTPLESYHDNVVKIIATPYDHDRYIESNFVWTHILIDFSDTSLSAAVYTLEHLWDNGSTNAKYQQTIEGYKLNIPTALYINCDYTNPEKTLDTLEFSKAITHHFENTDPKNRIAVFRMCVLVASSKHTFLCIDGDITAPMSTLSHQPISHLALVPSGDHTITPNDPVSDPPVDYNSEPSKIDNEITTLAQKIQNFGGDKNESET